MKLDPKHYEYASDESREQVLRNSLRWACIRHPIIGYTDKDFPGPLPDSRDSLTEMIRRTRIRLSRERNEESQKIIKFESEGDRLIKRLKK